MKARMLMIVVAVALFAGVASASHPITVLENPDVDCDTFVTIQDIGKVVDAFGEVGLEQGLCAGSGHYDGACTDNFIAEAIRDGHDVSWLKLRLAEHCLA